MKKPKLNPKVFRQAAEWIDNGTSSYCCPALSNANRVINGIPDAHFDTSERIFFQGMFCPGHFYRNQPYWPPGSEQSRQERVLALLLCAAMCNTAETCPLCNETEPCECTIIFILSTATTGAAGSRARRKRK
jgi:hypothetical protein